MVQQPGKTFEICDEYIAGWLSSFPAARLTPYVGILAVEPSSFVVLEHRDAAVKQTKTKYWDFPPGNRIRYRSDAEYEEQFLSLLFKAVERRLRSDHPVLCELSGGMDSSSIVCVADKILARGNSDCPQVDTISWFDDTYDDVEPDTNELHWIEKVEQKRSRTGHHLDFGKINASANRPREALSSDFGSKDLPTIPEPIGSATAFIKQYAAFLGREHRVTLSGIGGSEFTGGGVPTPVLELQDLISRAHFLKFFRQLEAWSLKTQQKKIRILWRVVRGFLPLNFVPAKDATSMPWLNPDFARGNQTALQGYPVRTRLYAPLASFQDCISTLDAVRRLLSSCRLRPDLLREARFPYLDVELLEFLFAIPREQIVGVGRRRHLVRRALKHVVPKEILSRRRKRFLPSDRCRSDSAQILEEFQQIRTMASCSLGFVDRGRLQQAVQRLELGEQTHIGALQKILSLEFWLQRLLSAGIIKTTSSLNQGVSGYKTQIRGGCSSSVTSEVKRQSTPVSDEISAG